MKALSASFFSLLLGVAIGWYFEHRHAEREMTDVVKQMQQPYEASDRLEAAMSIQAISLIESGDTQQVAQIFSFPIANFYSLYAPLTHNDKRTRDLLAKIDQFCKSNQVVAARIRESTNALFQLPSGWPNTALEPMPTAP